MLNYKLFVENMTGLSEVYGQEVTPAMMKIYYLALQELSDQQFKQAMNYIIQTHKFNCLPKPAEFLTLFHESKEQVAQEALLRLEEAISKDGYYGNVNVCNDKRIHKAVEHMGGWQKVSAMTDDEWIWAKKDFIKIYTSLLNRDDGDMPEKLIGFFEQDNTNKGTMELIAEHLRPKTTLIGQPQKLITGENNDTNKP